MRSREALKQMHPRYFDKPDENTPPSQPNYKRRGSFYLAPCGLCFWFRDNTILKLSHLWLFCRNKTDGSACKCISSYRSRLTLENMSLFLSWRRNRAHESKQKQWRFLNSSQALIVKMLRISRLKLFFVFIDVLAGNRVELSSSTVTFTKGVLGYLADGLAINSPKVTTVCD